MKANYCRRGTNDSLRACAQPACMDKQKNAQRVRPGLVAACEPFHVSLTSFHTTRSNYATKKVMKGLEIIHKMFLHLQHFLLGRPRHRNLAQVSSLSSGGSVLKSLHLISLQPPEENRRGHCSVVSLIRVGRRFLVKRRAENGSDWLSQRLWTLCVNKTQRVARQVTRFHAVPDWLWWCNHLPGLPFPNILGSFLAGHGKWINRLMECLIQCVGFTTLGV